MPTLQALLDSRHEVVAVITRPDAPAGRGRQVKQSPVAALATERGLPLLQPTSLRTPEVAAQIASFAPDVCAVVAYGALLPPELLEIPTHGWINLHFSVLPAWRGAAPVQHAIIAGDEVTGASTFVIERGLDTGPVLGLLTETIRPTDTAGDLLERLSGSGAELMTRTLDALEEGVITAVPQPTDGVSIAPRLTPQDALVTWTHPAIAVSRLVRGCTPAPGAWTTLPDGARLGLGPVTVLETADLAPGQLLVLKNAVHVGTATSDVALSTVTPAGRRPMDAAAWARGARLDGSTVLGQPTTRSGTSA